MELSYVLSPPRLFASLLKISELNYHGLTYHRENVFLPSHTTIAFSYNNWIIIVHISDLADTLPLTKTKNATRCCIYGDVELIHL